MPAKNEIDSSQNDMTPPGKAKRSIELDPSVTTTIFMKVRKFLPISTLTFGLPGKLADRKFSEIFTRYPMKQNVVPAVSWSFVVVTDGENTCENLCLYYNCLGKVTIRIICSKAEALKFLNCRSYPKSDLVQKSYFAIFKNFILLYFFCPYVTLHLLEIFAGLNINDKYFFFIFHYAKLFMLN